MYQYTTSCVYKRYYVHMFVYIVLSAGEMMYLDVTSVSAHVDGGARKQLLYCLWTVMGEIATD